MDTTVVEIMIVAEAINDAASTIGWSIFLGIVVLSITVYLTEIVLV